MDPILDAFLRHRKWESMFTPENMERGLECVNGERVGERIILQDEGARLTVRGAVRGDRENYSAEIHFEKDVRAGSVSVRSACTCGARNFCCHRYAVLFSATEQLESTVVMQTAGLRQEVAHWLDKLGKAAQPGPQVAPPAKTENQPFIAYTLWLHDKLGVLVVVRSAKRDAAGSVTFSDRQPDFTTRNLGRGIEPEDLEVFLALRKWQTIMHAGEWGVYGHVPAGKGSGKVLEKMLDSGRLFYTGEEVFVGKPVKRGEPRAMHPAWRQDERGRMKPVVRGEDPDWLPVLADTPWSLDPAGGTLHPAIPDHPPGFLALWADGPLLLQDDTLPTTEVLDHLPLALPRPVTTPIERLKPKATQPVLRLRRVSSADGIMLDMPPGGIVIGVLSFRYEGNREFAPLEENEDPVAKEHESDRLLLIHRPVDREVEEIEVMLDAGLMLLREVYGPTMLGPKFQGACLPIDGDSRDPLCWTLWKHDGNLQILLDRGWIFEEEPDAVIEMLSPGDDFLSLEEDKKDGIDWFAFDLGVEVDGKRVSLVPALAEALEHLGSDLLELEPSETDVIAVPVDKTGRRYLKLPMRRFVAMARHVFELFGGIPAGPLKLHRIVAAEVAKDAGDRLLRAETETMQALRKLGAGLDNFTGVQEIFPPGSLQATLRPYQMEGFRWLQFLARHGLHGILADDMGLGKTVQTIAHIVAEREHGHADGRPSLVVAPKSVVPNWEAEAKRFAPHLRVLVLHGSARSQYFDNIPDADLVITSYALVQRDCAVLATHKFHLIVLDEAQYIKNPATKAATSVRDLDGRHRLALSGTPIENHLGELWSLMRFLMPGVLGSHEEFRRHFRTPIEKHKDQDRQRSLSRRLKPLILRRTKDLVAKDLPPKTEITHGIDLTSEQADLYETVRVAMEQKVRDAIADRGLAKSQLIFLDALLKLRQICCDPVLLKTEVASKAPSAKLDFLMDLIDTLREEGRRMLLFSQFTEMLGRIEDRLKAAKIPYLKLTGETQNRGDLVEKFQAGEIPVFLISLKAGGTGLNLTAADTVIHYDPWWNPAAENQASDRAHRIGQTKPVFVHRLICVGTIEEKIQELQKLKAGLMDALFADSPSKFTLDRHTLDALLAPLAGED